MRASPTEARVLNLLKHELQSRLGAMLGWGIGLTLFGALYIGFYPEVGEQMADLADLSIYVALGMDLGSFAGYIASVVLQFLPVLLGIYAIITSTDALAGEEDSGHLELLLAMPLERWQIVSAKALAIALAAFVILVIAGAGNALVLNAIKATTPVDITARQLFGAILNGWPITMAFAMLGLFLGAYLPNRRLAALSLTVIFVANFFGKSLTGLVASLEPVRRFSLFHYLNTTVTVFTDGVRPGDVALLLGLAALFFVLALLSFQRRNVTVGAWPWQRPQVAPPPAR
jgi:ABC-2 type transport system permease protein